MSSNFQVTRVPSNSVVINISELHRYFPKIFRSVLTQIVKQKNLDKLREYGGVAGLASSLKTNLSDGINGEVEDISHRKDAFGSNTYRRLPTKKLSHFVWEALREPTYLILLVCSALLLGFQIKQHGLKEGWYDGGSIAVAVFVVIAISAITKFKQNREFVKLSEVRYTNIQVDVVRNGRRQQVSVIEIVAGDVVCLEVGDQVPADGLLIDGQHSLQVDESGMNGESDPVEVDVTHNPFLFYGTKVTAGDGRMLVTSVGMNTTWGEMMSKISIDSNEQTPLKFRLDKLTSTMGKVGVSVAFLVHVISYFIIRYTKDKNENPEYNGSKHNADDILNSVVGIIANAVTILVDAIPGGLPAAWTFTLAYSMKRMMRDHAMVGKLSASGTMGLATTLCLTDPCLGAKETVQEFQSAGVNVKMFTRYDISLAKMVAKECGILEPEQDIESGAVVEGEEFRNYTLEEQMENVDKIRVMARSSPNDKFLMVQCLKLKGHVVAVIGDGTNDVQALKEADIGISMGIQATKVAKACSDIIILDNNFGSVAVVFRWGRCVYSNVQKFIQLQLTVNVVTLVINFVASVSIGEIPLSAVQLVWVNLIMNTLGSLALATEKPTGEQMEKPPVGRTKQLLTNAMWRNLLSQAFYQIVVLLILQFKGEAIFNVSVNVNDTLIFNVLVLCQVFHVFALWKLEKRHVFEGIHKSKLFLGIIGVTIALQVVMVEFLKKIADTQRLNWLQWGVCVGFALVSWLIGWVVKWIPVPERPFLFHEVASSGKEVLSVDEVSNSSDEVANSGKEGFSGEEVLSGDVVAYAGEEVSNFGDEVSNSGDEVANSGDEVANSGKEVFSGNELSNSSEEVAKSGDEVLSGDEIAYAGEEVSNSGDEVSNSGDEVANSGDEVANSGKEIFSGNELSNSSEEVAKSGDEVLSGDEVANSGDKVLSVDEVSNSSDLV